MLSELICFLYNHKPYGTTASVLLELSFFASMPFMSTSAPSFKFFFSRRTNKVPTDLHKDADSYILSPEPRCLCFQRRASFCLWSTPTPQAVLALWFHDSQGLPSYGP